MSRNRNFLQNIYYSVFPEKVIWHELKSNKTIIKNETSSMIRNGLTISTYLTFIYFTNNYKIMESLIMLLI